MATRLRGSDGFISLSGMTKEWVDSNPSFSVYAHDKEVGRISKTQKGNTVEVFNNSYIALLEKVSEDALL